MPDIELVAYLAGALFNLGVALLILRAIYYPVGHDEQYILTYLTFSWVVRHLLHSPVSHRHHVSARIELEKPARRAELLAGLRARTGLSIRHVTIGRMNFVTNTAEVMVAYDEIDEPPSVGTPPELDTTPQPQEIPR